MVQPRAERALHAIAERLVVRGYTDRHAAVHQAALDAFLVSLLTFDFAREPTTPCRELIARARPPAAPPFGVEVVHAGRPYSQSENRPDAPAKSSHDVLLL